MDKKIEEVCIAWIRENRPDLRPTSPMEIFKAGYEAAVTKEVKEELRWLCGMLDHFRRFERVDDIRARYKLDEQGEK